MLCDQISKFHKNGTTSLLLTHLHVETPMLVVHNRSSDYVTATLPNCKEILKLELLLARGDMRDTRGNDLWHSNNVRDNPFPTSAGRWRNILFAAK